MTDAPPMPELPGVGPVIATQHVQDSPARVTYRPGFHILGTTGRREPLGVRTGAPFVAEGRDRKGEQKGIAHHRFQVGVVTVQWIGVGRILVAGPTPRRRHHLVHPEIQPAPQRFQTAPALPRPSSHQGTGDHHLGSPGLGFQTQLHPTVQDRHPTHPQVVKHHRAVQPSGVGPSPENGQRNTQGVGHGSVGRG